MKKLNLLPLATAAESNVFTAQVNRVGSVKLDNLSGIVCLSLEAGEGLLKTGIRITEDTSPLTASRIVSDFARYLNGSRNFTWLKEAIQPHQPAKDEAIAV